MMLAFLLQTRAKFKYGSFVAFPSCNATLQPCICPLSLQLSGSSPDSLKAETQSQGPKQAADTLRTKQEDGGGKTL